MFVIVSLATRLVFTYTSAVSFNPPSSEQKIEGLDWQNLACRDGRQDDDRIYKATPATDTQMKSRKIATPKPRKKFDHGDVKTLNNEDDQRDPETVLSELVASGLGSPHKPRLFSFRLPVRGISSSERN